CFYYKTSLVFTKALYKLIIQPASKFTVLPVGIFIAVIKLLLYIIPFIMQKECILFGIYNCPIHQITILRLPKADTITRMKCYADPFSVKLRTENSYYFPHC